MSRFLTAPDPYERCEQVCVHDLARGILVSELLSRDGPAGARLGGSRPAAGRSRARAPFLPPRRRIPA